MFCPNCGAELKDGSKFCPSCGTAIAESSNVKGKTNAGNSLDNKTLSNNPDAVVLKSSAPIPSKTGWTTWAYIISLLLIAAGGIGIICLIFVFIIEHFMMSSHRDKIRKMKFQFVTPVNSDEIYNKLQPTLMQKLSNKVEFDREGDKISVHYKSIIYDINLQEDGTFCIWWRKSLSGAIFSWNEWKLYKKIRTGTALIAYELQQQFGVNV